MKTLYLLRHAKAERKAPSGEDFDRPLAERGRQDAARLGKFMSAREMIPDMIVYSPSCRTLETVDQLVGRWPNMPPLASDQSLYLAEPEYIATCPRKLADAHRSAMIVGHNPGLEDFAGALAGGGTKDALARMSEKFPTCALAVFELDIERWADITRDKARLVAFYIAKDLALDGRT